MSAPDAVTGPRPPGAGSSAYQWVWTILWAVLAAVGGSITAAAQGWPTTICIAGVAAALYAGWYFSSQTRVREKQHRKLVSTLVATAIAATATAGWVSILGAGALLLPLAAVLSWPRTHRYLASRPRVRAGLRRLNHPAPGPGSGHRGPSPRVGQQPAAETVEQPATRAPEPHPTPVRGLTDQQLCRAWRSSFATLEHLLTTSDTTRQGQLITRRQEYLDELEHRNPDGFQRWLASGARPAGDPSRYL